MRKEANGAAAPPRPLETALTRPAGRVVRAVRPVLEATSMRALAALLYGAQRTSPPDWGSRPHRVLFVRYERIGDMIMATPLIRAIATSHPTIQLDVLASRINAPVLDGNPRVHRVLLLEGRSPRAYARLLRAVRRTGYDAVVDGRINTPRLFLTTPLVMIAARARYRIGWCDSTDPAALRFYNLPVEDTYAESGAVHYIDASARLVEPFGVARPTVDWRPELFLTRTEREAAEAVWRRSPNSGSRLLVNLSAPGRGRRWPDERFSAVVAAVRRERPEVVVGVMGLPEERRSVSAVAASAGALAIPTPTVRAAFAAIAAADRVFTPDTSVAHAAAALDKPAVVMLRRDALSYAPYAKTGTVLLWEGKDVGVLGAGEVTAAVLALLGHGVG